MCYHIGVYPKARTLLTKKRSFRSFFVGDDKFLENRASTLKLSEVSRINVELSEFKEVPSEKSKTKDIALFDEFFETEEVSKIESIESESPTEPTQEEKPTHPTKEASNSDPELSISSTSTSNPRPATASVGLTSSSSGMADIPDATDEGRLENTYSRIIVSNFDDQKQAVNVVRVEDTMEGLEESEDRSDGKGDKEVSDSKIASEAVRAASTNIIYSETSTEYSSSELEGREPNYELQARDLERYQKTEVTNTQSNAKSNLKTQSALNKDSLESPTLQSISESTVKAPIKPTQSIKIEPYTPYWSEVKTRESSKQRFDDSSYSRPVKISSSRIESNRAHPFRPIGNPVASIPIDNI